MDIVYILGSGSRWMNNEIKYSIKSVKKYLKGFRNIYVIGECPSWLKGEVIHISENDPYFYNKEANICYKIKKACENPNISDDFLFMNDDHFLLQPTNIEDIYPNSTDNLYPSNKTGKYNLARLNTYEALKAKGLTTYNYDIHTPIVYNKKKFLEVISQYDWAQEEVGFLVKSMYGNTLNLGYHPYDDCKIKNALTRPEIEEKVDGRWVFSISDSAINQDLIDFMEDEYSDKKPIEVKEDKKVSIIVPLYNQGHYLEECINSVLNQTYQNFEIIIVNDCSTDNSLEVAKEIAKKDSRIKILSNKVNIGLPATRNVGIEHASDEYIETLDADDKIHRQKIEKEVIVLNQGYDVAYTDVQDFGKSSNKWRAKQDWDKEAIKDHNLLCCCSMFKKSAWKAVGGYDEAMRDGYEDWMFWIKMAHAGYIGKRIPEALFYYRITHTGLHEHAKKNRPKVLKQMRDLHPEIFNPPINKIPKILFTTWISEKEAPEIFYKCFESWHKLMPDWDIRVISLKNIFDYGSSKWAEDRIKEKNYVLAGHWARLNWMHKIGGVYLDIDVEAIKRFDELLTNDFFCGAEDETWLNNAIMGSAKGNEFVAEMLKYTENFDVNHPKAALETGPRMVTKLLKERGWQGGNKDVTIGTNRVYNSKYFYPYHYTQKFTPDCIKPETISAHHWAGSWIQK